MIAPEHAIIPRRTDPSNGANPFESYKLSIEYFLDPGSTFALEDAVLVFHRWIRDRVLRDEITIDVASYAHVAKTPSVLLVCHRAHFSLSTGPTGTSLRYSRKRDSAGAFEKRLCGSFRAILEAMRLLERDVASKAAIHFCTDAFSFGIADRLLAPNDADTFNLVAPAITAFVSGLYDDASIECHPNTERRTPFSMQIRTSTAPSIDDLLARIREVTASRPDSPNPP